MKVDVDVCDDVTEDFGITALPSFALVESTIDGEKKMTKNSILNTFIGKNSPNMVRKEVQKWLTSIDVKIRSLKDNDAKRSYDQNENIATHRIGDLGPQLDSNNICRVKPKKKKSFTSLILRDSNTESESQK